MPPEVLACLESFPARRTRERSFCRVNSLVKSNGGRVFEAFTAVSTLALVQVTVSIQVVLFEMYPQLESDVTLLTTVRTLLPVIKYTN